MKSLSYVLGTETEIEVGKELYFGQIWDGNGDGWELLEDGSVSPDGENVVAFQIVEKNNEDALKSIVKVTDIY